MKISKYQKLFGVGPLGMAIASLLLVFLWVVDRRVGHLEILSHPQRIRIVGLILIGLWICWHIWCLMTIRQWWQHDRLCTNGPYRFVRHPLYSGGVMVGVPGISLLFNSWIVLLAPVLFYPVLSLLVRREEAMMAEVFGQGYKLYSARTGRLFPKILGR